MNAEDRRTTLARLREHRRRRAEALAEQNARIEAGEIAAGENLTSYAQQSSARKDMFDVALDEGYGHPYGYPGPLTRRTGREPAEMGGPGTTVDAVELLRGRVR